MWRSRAEKRQDTMRRVLKGEDGIFHDYDMASDSVSPYVSVASLYPLYFGLASEEEAHMSVRALSMLETEYGVVTCERLDFIKGNFQWGYPNGWPPMQIIAVGGLLRYGYIDEAVRIAEKFLSLVEDAFVKTGHLWEKYDVVKGCAEALAEYETPPMLGWTYGAYRYLNNVVKMYK